MDQPLDQTLRKSENHALNMETLVLSSGASVQVSKYAARFRAWTGMPVADSYGGKAVLDWQGQPVFAELAILYSLREEGFEGVWVDGYSHRFRVSLSEDQQPPAHVRELLDKIVQENDGKRQGCWDVLAWKDSRYVFAESKRKGKDRIRKTQVRWLEAALRAGVPLQCFCICEWEIEGPPPPSARQR
jgi:hypothetical protein